MLEHQLIGYLDSVRAKQPLPIRVKLWNDHVINLDPNPLVTIVLRRPWAARYLFNPSLDALGSAYVEGEIEIEGSVRDMMRVADILAKQGSKPDERGTRPAFWWTRHSKKSDIEAIQHHYDVSNQFYSYWLDRDMVYSCAYFRSGDESLEQAQQQKLDLVCRKLMLQPGERFLDVGAGWGGLLLWAAEHYGVQAHGITLSRNQHAHVNNLIEARGLAGRVTMELCDYRELPETEPFEKIASVGMFEHVGRARLPEYFAKMNRLLKPGGLLMNHGITAGGTRNHQLGAGIGDFIERYIFPGGELLHVSKVTELMSDAGLEPLDLENLRPHYARTLWAWSDALEAQLDAARELTRESVVRAYRVYLAGSAMSFEKGWLCLFQMLASKPSGDLGDGPMRGAQSQFPFNRGYMYASDSAAPAMPPDR